jgi:hypothetical protein
MARFRKAAGRTDLSIASLLPVAAAVLRSRVDNRSTPWIYDAHNDERRLAAQYRRLDQTKRIEALEDDAIRRSSATWVAGSLDLGTLRARHPKATLIDVPNGVETLPDVSGPKMLERTAFTYGSWDYPPNSQGLLRLADAQCTLTGSLHVFGAAPESFRHEILRRAAVAQPHVRWRFHGFVEQLSDMTRQAPGPAVIPVWMGAGTKLRAVQLAAMNVPLIATPEAVSGLPGWFTQAVYVESDPRSMLERALGMRGSLAGSPGLREKVLTNLAWPRIVANALTRSGLS